MRIAIDMQGAQTPFSRHRGVGRYTLNLARAMALHPRGHDIVLALNGAFAGSIEDIRNQFSGLVQRKDIRTWQQHYDCQAASPQNAGRGLAAKLTREAFLHSFDADIIFSTNLQEGLFDPAPTSVGLLQGRARFWTTLHDLIPLRFSEHYLSNPMVKAWYEEKIEFAKQSDFILTDSTHSKNDICELLGVSPDRTGVVYPAIDRQKFTPLNLSPAEADAVLTRLNLAPAFILYTGGNDRHKNLDRLYEAYARLPRSLRERHKLVMVGKELLNEVDAQREKTERLGIGDDVVFAGFVGDDDLIRLYNLCSLFVFPSIYEGFGLPALEALACGAPVIAANASSLPEVVGLDEALFDPYDTGDISARMEQALTDGDFRERLAAHAQQQAAKFSWASSATALFDLLERNAKPAERTGPEGGLEQVISGLARSELAGSLDDDELTSIAASLEETFPPSNRARRLFIDVSALVITEDHTGIQRVTRAISQQLHLHPHPGLQTCLVYTRPDCPEHYVAGRLIDSIEGNAPCSTESPAVSFYAGDILLFLDLHPRVAITHGERIGKLRHKGVGVYHVVYDLIPSLHPQYFWPELCDEFELWLKTVSQSDGVMCISQSVAREFDAWLGADKDRRKSGFHIDWFHLGADIEQSAPSRGLPEDAQAMLAKLAASKTFLMVGTVEPRKGHAQALDAFEALWREGLDVKLVIVGKLGWGMEPFAQRVNDHAQLGERLFWLASASDEYLEKLYANSACLLAASEAEGFGLPLIEAARHHVPILARDIPVFREVAADFASYFPGDSAASLARAVREWLRQDALGQAAQSSGLPWLTWKESAQSLVEKLLILDR